MAILLLVRHGRTDHTGKVISSWTPGIHLNAEGRRQAGRVGARLRKSGVEAIYSSPLERAAETAQPLADALGLPVTIRENLGEVRYGEWTGRVIDGMKSEPGWEKFCAFRSLYRAPGGETLLETQARVVAELDEIAARHQVGLVAIFSHSDSIRAALAYYLGLPLDFAWRLEISPASISAVDLSGPQPRIGAVNGEANVY